MKRRPMFPIWLFVNQDDTPDSPAYVLLLSSRAPHADFPATLPIFSTEKLAMESLYHSYPFVPKEVDEDTFHDILKNNTSIEYVALDVGNENAIKYRVEELLAQLN